MFNSNIFFSNVKEFTPFDDEYYEPAPAYEGEQNNLDEFKDAPTQTPEDMIELFGWSPDYQFAIDERDTPQDIKEVQRKLSAMRRTHSVVNYGGTTFIHWKDSNAGMQFQKPGDFHSYEARNLCYIKVENAKGVEYNKEVSISKEFMKDPWSTRYEGIEFTPGQANKNFLNFWKGWKLTPKFSDIALFKLLLRALTDDDAACYEYMMNYLAHMVQKPDEKPEVAIVMKGPQGIGKGSLMDMLAKFNDNFKHLTSTQSLTGQFSGHLLDAFIVFADEAVWGGDKQAEGRLKAMITESTVSIRALHKDEVYVKSFVRLFVASNENWVVPVGEGDRRYFVLECSPRYKGMVGKGQFFYEYNKWMENGGAEAVFYELLNRDITDFNPRVFPVTQARLDMQVRSLNICERFIYELLNDQVMLTEGTHTTKDGKHQFGKMGLYQDFVDWCNLQRRHYIPSQDELSKALAKQLDFAKDDPNWGKNWKRSTNTKRENCYIMGDMDIMKERFARNIFNAAAEQIFINYKNP